MTPLLSALLGACIGSFLNVCLYRWKSGGQIVSPSSHCPDCKKAIPWFDNIPVLSFFLLNGRCRFCDKSISWQYPLVEISTSVLFFLSFLKFGEFSFFLVLASFFFISFLVLLAVSDLKWWVLPHPFNNLFILMGLVFSNDLFFQISNLYKAGSNFVVIGALLFGLTLFSPKGLGGGDIKMVCGLAIWTGLFKAVLILLLSFGMGLLFVLPLLLKNTITMKSPIRFGPFLALGALGVWFWPENIDRLRIVLMRMV